MKIRASFASNEVVVTHQFQPDTTISTVKLYKDACGGFWQFIRVAITHDAVNELRLQHQAGEVNLEIEPLEEAVLPDDLREVEMKWLQDHHSEVAALYPGEWIAIDGAKLVAHAGDLPTLLKLSREAGHRHPFITAIPSEPVVSVHA